MRVYSRERREPDSRGTSDDIDGSEKHVSSEQKSETEGALKQNAGYVN